MNHDEQMAYERLDWVGKLMLDVGRVFAAGGTAVPSEYADRILRHRKQQIPSP